MNTTLKPLEEIKFTARQHWVQLVLPILLWVLVTVGLVWWLHNWIALLIIVLVAIIPIMKYVNWKYNLWVVTDIRVIDERGYFTRYSKESPLDRINNVEYDQSIIGRMLSFGNVEIHTTAELSLTRFEFIKNPMLFKDAITNAQEEYKKQPIYVQAAPQANNVDLHNTPPHTNTHPLIADELHKLFILTQRGILTQEEYSVQKSKILNRN